MVSLSKLFSKKPEEAALPSFSGLIKGGKSNFEACVQKERKGVIYCVVKPEFYDHSNFQEQHSSVLKDSTPTAQANRSYGYPKLAFELSSSKDGKKWVATPAIATIFPDSSGSPARKCLKYQIGRRQIWYSEFCNSIPGNKKPETLPIEDFDSETIEFFQIHEPDQNQGTSKGGPRKHRQPQEALHVKNNEINGLHQQFTPVYPIPTASA
jgi:hypothetical protein